MDKWSNGMRGLTIAGLVLLGAAGAGAGKLFYDMVKHMETMTAHVGQIASDVTAMNKSMATMTTEIKDMRLSIDRMQTYMAHMDTAISGGARQIRQVNPMNFMEGIVPGPDRRR